MAETNKKTTRDSGKIAATNSCDDKPIADLLVESFETSVRTGFRMLSVPIVCYTGLLQSWSKAMESAMREIDPAQRGKQ